MDFAASFLLQLRLLTDAVERNSGRLERLAESIPVQADVSQQGIIPTGGLLALDLGAPPQGTYWVVRSLVVGGVTATTVAAGTAWVNVQGAPIEGGIIPLITVRDNATSLPLNAFYEDRQLVVVPPAHLWVTVVGGTVGQQYAAEAICDGYLDLAAADEFLKLLMSVEEPEAEKFRGVPE